MRKYEQRGYSISIRPNLVDVLDEETTIKNAFNFQGITEYPKYIEMDVDVNDLDGALDAVRKFFEAQC